MKIVWWMIVPMVTAVPELPDRSVLEKSGLSEAFDALWEGFSEQHTTPCESPVGLGWIENSTGCMDEIDRMVEDPCNTRSNMAYLMAMNDSEDPSILRLLMLQAFGSMAMHSGLDDHGMDNLIIAMYARYVSGVVGGKDDVVDGVDKEANKMLEDFETSWEAGMAAVEVVGENYKGGYIPEFTEFVGVVVGKVWPGLVDTVIPELCVAFGIEPSGAEIRILPPYST